MKLRKLFMRTMKVMGKRCIIYFTAIFFMSSSISMFAIMCSLLMKNVVDAAQTGDSEHLLIAIIGNVAGGLASRLVFRASSIAYNVEAKRAYSVLAKQLFHHEVRLPYTYYEEHHSGDFMSKLSYDLEKTASIYGSRFRRTVDPLIQLLVFLVPMFILSWQITLCLVGVNSIMLLINGLLINPMRKNEKILSAVNVRLTEKLSNLLQGMEQARMYSAGRNTVEEFVKENRAYEKKNDRKLLYTACLESCNNGFELLCVLVFLMLGIYFVQGGYTTLGSLTAIYSLYGNFSFQFLQLGRYIPELISCLANAQNIFEFMDEVEEPESWYGDVEDKEIDMVMGKNINLNKNIKPEANMGIGIKAENDDVRAPYISMKDITFHYSEDKPLMEDFNFSVKEGESVAVTGPSGCGKTTLSKLLLSLYPVMAGDIIFSGVTYRELSNAKIRARIAYVPQEPYLFNESVMENIRIGRTDASDEEIVEAAKLANAHDFITQLENGYDTNVGERGNRLSGGQRQRIAIARAILKKAPLLLLDEATSALDNESEQLVNDALKSMKQGRTIVMIAHRPSTTQLADRVYSFK